MISFRVTAEEYERFRQLCYTCGTRSVSELARAAINALLNEETPLPRQTLEYQVAALEARVSMLRVEFGKLRDRQAQTSEDPQPIATPPDS